MRFSCVSHRCLLSLSERDVRLCQLSSEVQCASYYLQDGALSLGTSIAAATLPRAELEGGSKDLQCLSYREICRAVGEVVGLRTHFIHTGNRSQDSCKGTQSPSAFLLPPFDVSSLRSCSSTARQLIESVYIFSVYILCNTGAVCLGA